MKSLSQTILDTIVPCIIFGIFIALSIAIIMFMSYLLLWGIGIGLVLWLGIIIKEKFCPKTKTTPSSTSGIIIEHKDIDE